MDDQLTALGRHLTAGGPDLQEKLALLTANVAALDSIQTDSLVVYLKNFADQSRRSGKAAHAYEAGQIIIEIGCLRESLTYQGLGYMVCGDARNGDSRYLEAWDLLEDAGRLHKLALAAGEPNADFNWARTIIGKWWCVLGNERIEQVKREAAEAETIFIQSKDPTALEKRITLYQNMGIWLTRDGQFEAALAKFEAILALIQQHGESRQGQVAEIHVNIGHIHYECGRARQSEAHYRQADELLAELDQTEWKLIVQQGIAMTELQRALYRPALKSISKVINHPSVSLLNWCYGMRTRIVCFLEMSDFHSAENSAKEMLTHDLGSGDLEWFANDALAIAQAELGKYKQAITTLEGAIHIAAERDLSVHLMHSYLHRARIMINQGQFSEAQAMAEIAHQHLAKAGHVSAMDAKLILAEAIWRSKQDLTAARAFCDEALQLAGAQNSPRHIHDANVLLGHLTRTENNLKHAQQHYLAALEIIDYVQRDLTIAYRPRFLSNKGEALSGLIDLYLAETKPEAAFALLERSKQQTLVAYLARNGGHRWAEDDRSQELRIELDQLRQDLVARINVEEDKSYTEESLRLRGKVQSLTRELYNRANSNPHLFPVNNVEQIRQRLPQHSTLVAYFDDGHTIRALVMLPQREIQVFECGASGKIRKLQVDLEREVQFALGNLALIPASDSQGNSAILRHPLLNNLTQKKSFDTVASALYDALIRPILGVLEQCERLYIMPHRALHFVPFHLLRSETDYLIATHEVVILPSASLLTEPPTNYPPGALTLFDERNRQLKFPAHDAALLQKIIGGECLSAKGENVLKLLKEQRGQILHIIAHAKFEPDLPETSFIQFDDREFFLSDLLQNELQFRLVTLTACETGKSKLTEIGTHLAYGDDLIGIGRAFLYAGAQAVVTSQWVIGDGLSLPLLTQFYEAVMAGKSIAAALREAQVSMVAQYSTLHPAFWGGFQLVGNAEVLAMH